MVGLVCISAISFVRLFIYLLCVCVWTNGGIDLIGCVKEGLRVTYLSVRVSALKSESVLLAAGGAGSVYHQQVRERYGVMH